MTEQVVTSNDAFSLLLDAALVETPRSLTEDSCSFAQQLYTAACLMTSIEPLSLLSTLEISILMS